MTTPLYDRADHALCALDALFDLLSTVAEHEQEALTGHGFGILHLAKPHLAALRDATEANQALALELARAPSPHRPLVPARWLQNEVLIDLRRARDMLAGIERTVGAEAYPDEVPVIRPRPAAWANLHDVQPMGDAAPEGAALEDAVRKVVERMQAKAEAEALAEGRKAR